MSTQPAYGRRLVPQVLDELATTDPRRVYAAIPRTADVKNGYRDITVANLARCVNFMAKWIEDKFGRSESFETITYIGLSDLKGIVALLAAIKTGYKASLQPSWLLYAEELAPLIKPLKDMDPSVSFNAIPAFELMLDSETEHYSFEKGFEEAKNDPIVVLHSSGSTGLPKPITITITHGSIGAHDNDHNLPAPAGRKKADSTVFTLDGEGRRLCLILPFFHLGGFVFFMDHAILNNLTLVLGPPQVAPDATLLKDVARQQKLRAIMVVPAILEQLLHDPKSIDLLKSLDFVGCAGAPLPTAVGDRIMGIVRLYDFIGSTETFPLPELAKSPEDWQYHEFNSNFKHEMRLYDVQTETFELVILADETTQDAAPVYHNLPGENPYFTKDLFTKHPTKPNLYKFYGRRDDILVLSNGEKLNPIPLEQHVQGSPDLKGVMLVGNGRNQTALIVEPREALELTGRTKLLGDLWPRIEEANTHVPGPGRVARGMIICASPDKAFARTGKGTVVRKLTEELYQEGISKLYSGLSQQDKTITVGLTANLKTIYEPAAVIEFLRQIFAPSFPPAATFGEEDEFFAHGLDSIQTLEITTNLKRNLERLTSRSVAWISPRTIFRHPTLNDLSELLAAYLNDGITPAEDPQTARAAAVDDAVARYVENLPSRAVSQPISSSSISSSVTVAIVGSTGYVGAHLVANLLRNPAISRIYCLDRGNDAPTRQREVLSKQHLVHDDMLAKLTFFKTNLGTLHLGLSEEQYRTLVNDVDVVVYNAWRLDFGLAIRSFDPFLQATRDLIELSVASRHNMRIVFVSSVSSVETLALSDSIVPEAPVEDPLAAMNTGYGQSKLAAERILVTAQREYGIPVSVVRVGQVGGPSSGDLAWPDQAWISAIIRTSKALKCFPIQVVPIDWVAVDTVARILESVILQPYKNPDAPQFFNVASEPQPWSMLLDVLREFWSADDLEAVSLPGWVNKLRAMASTSAAPDVAKLPALRLVDFYDLLGNGSDSMTYATEQTRAVCGVDLAPGASNVHCTPDWDIR
ncbi:putative NRPS-like protein biosynthetic cluster [Diaporthe australafricana]|uniref:NRPS-like protein biosynthetic cluster n=1 Tax=Diaporthe australafricana TaxID=127596 RepID=A0ABR3Y7U6_9PEZI